MKKRLFKRPFRFLATVCVWTTLLSCLALTPLPADAAMPADSSAEWSESMELDQLHPLIVSEDVSKRDANEKHFLCDDGTYIALCYPEDVHMLRDGQWVDKDFELVRQANAIVPANGESYSFAREAGEASSSLVSMSAEGRTISWELMGTDQEKQPVSLAASPAVIDQPAAQAVQAEPAAAAEAESLSLESLQQRTADLKSARSVEELDSGELTDLAEDIDAYNRQFLNDVSFGESSVTYPDALGQGVDVRYTASEGRIKEDVIVGQPGLLASYTAVLQLGGLQASIDQQGGIAYADETGRVLFTTAPPLMYDADGVPSEAVQVELTVREDTAYITYTPDPEWMADPERVYPVVLDPLYTNTLAQNVQIDTYVHSGNTSSGQNDSSTTLYVGNKSVSGTRRPHYAYWRVERDSMPTLPSGTYITSATFSFRLVNGTSTRGAMQLYGVSSSAGEWSSSNMLWSNKPAQGSLIETWAANTSLSSSSLTMSASVTDHVIGWYANEQRTNTGFMLRYSFTDYADHNSLYSSDYRGSNYLDCIPQLVIYYATPTRTIADGVYFIRNRLSGMYLDLTGNGTSDGTLVQQFPKGDYPSEIWEVTYLPETGNYRIEACMADQDPESEDPRYEKVLDARGSAPLQPGTRAVIWTSGDHTEQRWKIHSKGNGYYQLAPESNYSLAIQAENGSMTSNAKIALAERGPGYTQQWAFERVDIGNGGLYRPVSTKEPNCFGYAMFENSDVTPSFTIFDTSSQTESYSDKFQAVIEKYAVSCRRIDSHTSSIASDEYRVAIRVPRFQHGNGYGNYHVIYQLSDGSWAGKNATAPSKRLGWGDPSITPYMWDGDSYYPQSCGTIYFAVKRW